MHTPKNAAKYAISTPRWFGSHPDGNPLVASLAISFIRVFSLAGLYRIAMIDQSSLGGHPRAPIFFGLNVLRHMYSSTPAFVFFLKFSLV